MMATFDASCVILSRKWSPNVTKWLFTNLNNNSNTTGKHWKIFLINYSKPSPWWEHQYQKSWVIWLNF